MIDSNSTIQYLRIIPDNNDCLVKIEEGKLPIIIQKSALQNRLVNIGAKKTKMQRDINDLSNEEQNILDEIDKMDLVFNS